MRCSTKKINKEIEEVRKTLAGQLTFWQRLSFALAAFNLKPYKITMPHQYYCNLVPNPGVCDNNRRTGCKNEAKVALTRPCIEITIEETELETGYYHVCNECAEKAIGKH